MGRAAHRERGRLIRTLAASSYQSRALVYKSSDQVGQGGSLVAKKTSHTPPRVLALRRRQCAPAQAVQRLEADNIKGLHVVGLAAKKKTRK